IIETEYLNLRKDFTIPDKTFFPLVYQFLGRHTSTIHRGLSKFDYIPTGEPLLPELVGAEILYASPFRKALSDSVSQAQESGLFSRAEHNQEFEVQYRSHSTGVSSAPEVLSLGDLKPFFLVWSAGLAAAVLVLLLELAAAYSRTLCVKSRRLKRETGQNLSLRR
ncbi:unnamed protein product, partial [Ixodes hexagonus]